MKKTKEVVINTCYGGFRLSNLAYEELIRSGIPVRKYTQKENYNHDRVIYYKESPDGLPEKYWDSWVDNDRENPALIKVIKKLGRMANTWASDLKIVKIPIDVEYTIEEYDGLEHIAEKHRTWY